MDHKSSSKRIEEKSEVRTYLDRLKYAITKGVAQISFQKDRGVDKARNRRFTNRYTIGQLFPDEDEVEALKRELLLLNVEDYIETVKDLRFLNRSEMRVFGRNYAQGDVYVKIRVELVNTTHFNGGGFVLVMSFHFTELGFEESDFPYRESR